MRLLGPNLQRDLPRAQLPRNLDAPQWGFRWRILWMEFALKQTVPREKLIKFLHKNVLIKMTIAILWETLWFEEFIHYPCKGILIVKLRWFIFYFSKYFSWLLFHLIIITMISKKNFFFYFTVQNFFNGLSCFHLLIFIGLFKKNHFLFSLKLTRPSNKQSITTICSWIKFVFFDHLFFACVFVFGYESIPSPDWNFVVLSRNIPTGMLVQIF